MEKAIQKAILGGYTEIDEETLYRLHWSLPCSDPLFWKCLSKSEGWEKGYYHTHYCKGRFVSRVKRGFGVEEYWRKPHSVTRKIIPKLPWKKVWHQHTEHLANNGDNETFFRKLLK